MNDSGAIKGMDAREDGVYITYSTGADTVTKKLGSQYVIEVVTSGTGSAGGTGITLTVSDVNGEQLYTNNINNRVSGTRMTYTTP